MGDKVQCTAVLKKSADRSLPDSLFLSTDPDFLDARILSVYPLGTQGERVQPSWIYEELPAGKLRMTPSLHCKDTGFHTEGVWDVAYELCPDEALSYDFFLLKNPSIAIR